MMFFLRKYERPFLIQSRHSYGIPGAAEIELRSTNTLLVVSLSKK